MDPSQQPNQPPATPVQLPQPFGAGGASGDHSNIPPSPSYQPGIGTLPTPTAVPIASVPVSELQPTPAVSQQSTPMLPNQPVVAPTPSYSADYLNQIAAPTTKKTPSKFAVIGLIGGVLLAAIFALLLINTSGSPSFTAQAKIINARIGTLQTVAAAQQKVLTENSISEANATLVSSLATMNTDLAALSATKDKKDDKALAAQESAYQSTLATTLDNANQRGTLDRTYTVQMSYELTLLRGMIVKLKNSTNKDSIKTFCTTSLSNLDIILKQYAEFSASKS